MAKVTIRQAAAALSAIEEELRLCRNNQRETERYSPSPERIAFEVERETRLMAIKVVLEALLDEE